MVYLMLFFLLLETFCRGAQKFISLLTLMIRSSDDKLTLLHSKWSSASQSIFSSCSDIVSLLFSILWKYHYSWSSLLFSKELCWFPIIKNWTWWSDKVMTRLPEKYGELQIAEYIVSQGCWCCCSASWAGSVWKKKGWIHWIKGVLNVTVCMIF